MGDLDVPSAVEVSKEVGQAAHSLPGDRLQHPGMIWAHGWEHGGAGQADDDDRHSAQHIDRSNIGPVSTRHPKWAKWTGAHCPGPQPPTSTLKPAFRCRAHLLT